MQKINKGLFTSETDKWNTPNNLIQDLSLVFDWDLDVCASSNNVCDFYFNEKDNGLKCDWRGLCWMNPPYGKEISKWIFRARIHGLLPGTTVVCLLPARTDTKWWHNNISFASHVVFIKGRLKFGDQKGSAPFPSAFVVFGELNDEQRNKLASYGWSIEI